MKYLALTTPALKSAVDSFATLTPDRLNSVGAA